MNDRLLDLLIEFDEMGFAPTTVCENAEEYATKWEDQVREAVKALENENAALHERLEKMVELPVKVGDTVYLVGMCFCDGYNDNLEPVTSQGWKMYPQKVTEKNLYRICDAMVKGNGFLYEKEAAELLEKLKGGKA